MFPYDVVTRHTAQHALASDVHKNGKSDKGKLKKPVGIYTVFFIYSYKRSVNLRNSWSSH